VCDIAYLTVIFGLYRILLSIVCHEFSPLWEFHNHTVTPFVEPDGSLLCSPPLVPILSQMNPVHTLTHYSLKIHFNIILSLIISSGLPTKMYAFLLCVLHVPTVSLPWFEHFIKFLHNGSSYKKVCTSRIKLASLRSTDLKHSSLWCIFNNRQGQRTTYMRVYPKVSGLAAWSENCKWFSSLTLGAVVSLFCESM
jgi:hypothetical protein